MRIYILEQKLVESHHISEALKEYFPSEQAPATTWIGVRALANEEFLIEIEAIAVIDRYRSSWRIAGNEHPGQ